MSWLDDFFGRVNNGVSPWQALTTAAPKASDNNTMGPGTYAPYGGTLDPTAPAMSNTQALSAPAGGAVLGSGASGGGGAYDPNADPNLIGQARAQVQPLIPQLNQMYGDLNSSIDGYAQDARNTIDSNYNQQYANDASTYGRTNDATNGHFVGTNAYDSSARGNALDGNKQVFDAAEQNLHDAQNGNYADLGRIVSTNKAALAGGPPQYDLSKYTDVNSLLGLRDQLNQHIASLGQMKQNLATPGQLRDQLNAVAPAKSGAGDALASRLQALNASSGAPASDKFGIAQGYINQSGLSPDEQNKYLTYFQSLLGQGTKAPAV